MSIYYLLLAMMRFHSDPRLGIALFNAGIVLITPVKLVGLLALAAALFLPRPRAAAPRLAGTLSALFVAFAALPIVETIAFRRSLPTMSLSSLISYLLLLIAVRHLISTRERMLKTVRVVILVSGFATLWVFKQHFLGHVSRPSGVEQDPNYEALTLVTGIPLAFWLARHEAGKWWRRAGVGCAVLMTIAVVLTQSRAGLIALAVMGLAALIYSRRRLLTLGLLALVALSVIVIAPAGLGDRFENIKISGPIANGDQESARIHYELVLAGLTMIRANPLFGVGLDRFKQVAPEYDPRLLQVAGHRFIAHDTYIQIGAEGGLPMLALFLALIVVTVMNLNSTSRIDSQDLGDLGRAMKLSLIAYAVAAASVTAVYIFTFWLIIFLSPNLREIAEDGRAQRARIRERVTTARRPETGRTGRPRSIRSAAS